MAACLPVSHFTSLHVFWSSDSSLLNFIKFAALHVNISPTRLMITLTID
jgi:hypothetical protein